MQSVKDAPSHAALLPENRPNALERLLADERLAERLRNVDIVPLLLVTTHLRGDADWLERFGPHIKGPWSFDVDAPEELREELRQDLVRLLQARVLGGRWDCGHSVF